MKLMIYGFFVDVIWLVKDDKLPPDAAKPRVLSSAALTFEQASKLGLGQTQNVTVFFTSHQVLL